MRHHVPGLAHACWPSWPMRLTASLMIVTAVACGDATTSATSPQSSITSPAHASVPATEFASLAAAGDDARSRLLAPLAETPGVEALADALARFSLALAAGDASSAYHAIPGLESALAAVTRAAPAAASDLDAVRLVVDRATQTLDERTKTGGP